MEKILYLECIGGVSGDMCLGALVDLGVPAAHLQEELDRLVGPGKVSIAHSFREEHGIRASRVRVDLQEKAHVHRHLGDILKMVDESALDQAVKERIERVFRRLADAEGRVHGVAPEKIHFHEVGALDAIADVAGTCLGIHHLGADRVYAGPLKTGRGTVRAAHGVLPLPAPATLELAGGWTMEYLDMEGELTTPTGAALITTLAEERRSLSLRADRSGYGCGERRYPGLPNLLRATLGTAPEP